MGYAVTSQPGYMGYTSTDNVLFHDVNEYSTTSVGGVNVVNYIFTERFTNDSNFKLKFSLKAVGAAGKSCKLIVLQQEPYFFPSLVNQTCLLDVYTDYESAVFYTQSYLPGITYLECWLAVPSGVGTAYVKDIKLCGNQSPLTFKT